MKHYVYVWRIKETGEVIYVGKGSGNRWKSMKNRNETFKKLVKEFECECKIVKYFENEEEAYEFEKQLGTYYLSIGQCNGCHEFGQKGKFVDDETIEKMKPTMFEKENEPWNKGKKMPLEFRENCRERQLGKTQSKETRLKRSRALIGHTVSKETRKKIGASKMKRCVKMDKDTFEIIKEYECMSDVALEHGVSLSMITMACKKFPKPYKGYCYKIIEQGNPESV